MASPLGHVLVGVALHVATATDRAERNDLRRVLGFAALSVGADLDLLGRLIDGGYHHHGFTHSVGFAAAVVCVLWGWGGWRHWSRPGRAGLLAGLVWLSHGLVDYASWDSSPPLGPMLLWPFSHRHWMFPWPVFLETSRALAWSAVRKNALAMAWESALLIPILAVVWRLKGRRTRSAE